MSVIEMRFCFSFWQLVCVALVLLINPRFTYSQDVLDTSVPIVTLEPKLLEPNEDLGAVPDLQPNGDVGEAESVEEEKDLKIESVEVKDEEEEAEEEAEEAAEELKEEAVELSEEVKEIEEEEEEEATEEGIEAEKEAEVEEEREEEIEVEEEEKEEEEEEEVAEEEEEEEEIEAEKEAEEVEEKEVKEEIEAVAEEKEVEEEKEEEEEEEEEEEDEEEEIEAEKEAEEVEVKEEVEKEEVKEETEAEKEVKEEKEEKEVKEEVKEETEAEKEIKEEIEAEKEGKEVEVEEVKEAEGEKEEKEPGKAVPTFKPIDSELVPEPEPESDGPAVEIVVEEPTALPENDAALSTVQPSPPAVTTDIPEKVTKAPKKPKKPRRKPKKPKKPKRPKKGTKAPKKVTTTPPKIVITTTTTTTPKVMVTTMAAPKVVTKAPKKPVEPPIVKVEVPKPKKEEKKEEPCVDVFSVEQKRYQCKGYWKRGLAILAMQIDKLKRENQELFLKVIDANGKMTLAKESIAEYKIDFKALKKKFAWPDKNNLGNTHKDCSDAFKKDHKKPGVYLIHPAGSPYKVHLLCIDGWTIIQRRFDGSENFHRSFDEYLSGFGNFSGEFFVGLENLHRMTLSQAYTLRVDVKSAAGKWYFAVYNNFAVSDETDEFRLKLGNMTASNSEDVMDQSRDRPFSAYDRDNDEWSGGNCAQHFRGGWWSGNCITNLNQMWCNNGCLRWGDTRVVSSLMRIRLTSTADPDDMTETPNPVGFSIN